MTLVLIVEDEARIARAMQITLQAHGYQALSVGNGADALQAAANQPVEIVVLDLGPAAMCTVAAVISATIRKDAVKKEPVGVA